MSRVEDPTDRIEQELFASGVRYIAGIDEVGRGAWAGPVSVGIAVGDAQALTLLPKGVRDSKMLSPTRREQLFPDIALAVSAYAVGHASAGECDALGMTKAQALATKRAFGELAVTPEAVIIDGIVNFTDFDRMVLLPGADRLSLLVAAASVLAKVTRDRMMVGLDANFPGYNFARNKGYPSPEHLEGLADLGMADIHRKSWSFADRFQRCAGSVNAAQPERLFSEG